MFNNPLYLNRTSLEIASGFADGDILFRQGEMLQGVVKEAHDGMVMLALKGQVIEAAAQIPVTIGETLLLTVDTVEAGRVSLKVMNSVELQPKEDQIIAERLMEMGVLPKPAHINMARQLLNYDLLLNRPNMEALIKNTALLGGTTAANINLAAFQLARGFPHDLTMLKSLEQYCTQNTDINSLFDEALQAFTRLLSSARPGAQPPSTPGPDPLGNPAVLNLNSTAPPATARPHQTALGASQDAVTASAANQTAVPVRPTDGFLKELLNLLKAELESQRLQLDEDPSPMGGRLQQSLRARPELLRGLLLLEAALKQGEGQITDRAAWAHTMGKTETLIRELLGQQLMNLNPASTDEPVQYYFSFPVQWGTATKRCEVRIAGEPGKSPWGERQQITVAVALQTSRLGEVLFHVAWQPCKQLELRGVVDSQAAYSLLRPRLCELIQALQEMGYAVKDFGLKISNPKKGDSLKNIPRPPVKPETGGWLKIDLRV